VLIYTVLNNQIDIGHGIVLPDTVAPILRLHPVFKVKVVRVVDHIVRTGERQPVPRCLRVADKEPHRGIDVLKILNQLFPILVLGRTVERTC